MKQCQFSLMTPQTHSTPKSAMILSHTVAGMGRTNKTLSKSARVSGRTYGHIFFHLRKCIHMMGTQAINWKNRQKFLWFKLAPSTRSGSSLDSICNTRTISFITVRNRWSVWIGTCRMIHPNQPRNHPLALGVVPGDPVAVSGKRFPNFPRTV